jgi:hypothetical protein
VGNYYDENLFGLMGALLLIQSEEWVSWQTLGGTAKADNSWAAGTKGEALLVWTMNPLYLIVTSYPVSKP